MITSVRLQNFRKYRDMKVDFQTGSTTITGPNGSGKTSIVEAIYIALQGKSWRSDFSEILNRNAEADWWRVDVAFDDGGTRTIKFADGKKSFEVGNQVYARLPAKLKKPVIIFEPNDLQLLYGSPSRRRAFFDRFIAQAEPSHATNLRRFERVLAQRNNLLKNGVGQTSLFVWDIQFADLAEKIITARELWIGKINDLVAANYQSISNESDSVQIRYSSALKTKQQIMDQLSSDYRSGHPFTKSGPQTHDVNININGQEAKSTASRGENRTIIFAILYSMVSLMNQQFGPGVYLIFDDIDSELDQTHRNNLYTNKIFKDNFLFTTTIESDRPSANRLRLG